ncbi:MAG: cytochrome c biogenesis protein CcsA [Bacteroidia bacterium]
MKYIGEQLLWGQLGHFFVVLAFVTAVFSVITNLIRTYNKTLDPGWKNIGRSLFVIHAVAVIGIFVTLLSMLIAHRFEYQYVWQHSKRDMKMNYVLACLWEGQEGSTLLWLFWHSIIGLVLMRRAKEWEAPVMTVVSLVQVFLSMMLLGVYLGKIHIGSNPFELMRLKESNLGLPWTKIPDYLTSIPLFRDGRGLNPLLQNYWMTIHPPTLFLGFALTTVPFAYAIAGLMTKKYHDWQRPALTWTYIGVMVLGTGILMGGAWAYESLSFGGFWAWDPVENASLVPWLVLIGAAHVMLLYRNKGQSLFTTFFLCIATFLLIVYSTFLTKSGILSDTSVHAFTDDGLNEELTFFMGFFLWLSVFLLSFNWRLKVIYTGIAAIVFVRFLAGHHASSMMILLLASLISLIIGYVKFFPKAQTESEEDLWSREFWMFIASLVLLLAGFQIIFYTSSPVINKFLRIDIIHSFFQWFYDTTGWLQKLAEARLAPDEKVVLFYNRWQIPFACIVSLLMAVTQFFKYRRTDFNVFLKQILRPLIISIIITVPLVIIIYFNSNYKTLNPDKQGIYIICSFLVFTSIFSILANADYWLKVFKGKISKAGASIAHIGFSLLLLGAVISTSKKDTFSKNTSHTDINQLVQGASNTENIYLRKGDTLPMGSYLITYTKRERIIRDGTPYIYFHVDFLENNNGKTEKAFTLTPFFQLNKFMGNAAEPDTRHFIHKDIYTFVKFVDPAVFSDTTNYTEDNGNQFDKPQNHTVAVGDTIGLDNAIAVLDTIVRIDSTHDLYKADEYGIAARFNVFDGSMNEKHLTAYYFINKNSGVTRQVDAVDEALGVKLTFWKVRPESNKIDIYSAIKLSKKADFIVMEASIFPGINVLWIGCIIMIIGTFLAVRERKRKNNPDKISGEKETV